MRITAHSEARGRLGPPSDETIQRERRQQDQAVVALRKMLDKTAGSDQDLLLFSAA